MEVGITVAEPNTLRPTLVMLVAAVPPLASATPKTLATPLVPTASCALWPVGRLFVAVAETGRMTIAAKVVNLSQGAVSQQIKRLESFFETRLLAVYANRLCTSIGYCFGSFNNLRMTPGDNP